MGGWVEIQLSVPEIINFFNLTAGWNRLGQLVCSVTGHLENRSRPSFQWLIYPVHYHQS